MRILITKTEMGLEDLASSLARTPRAAAAVRARLVALNPHLTEAARVPKGGVLVIPDGPDIKAGAGTTLSSNNLGELGEKFAASTRAATSLAATRLESLNADRTAVRDALKSAAAKRLVASDPLLQKQLAAAEAHFKAEQKRAAEVTAQFKKTAELAQAEMARLQKLSG